MGVALNFRRNALGHEIRIAERFPIADTHDPIALPSKPFVAFGIMQFGFGVIMPAAVDFNDETRAMMNEVGDVATDWRLPANMELQRTKGFPKSSFVNSHPLAETTGALDGAGDVTRSWRFLGHAVTPIPSPSPIKGGRENIKETSI